MKNYVVESYENYREESFGKELKILDCAAGTGIYAFHLAQQGHQVTATDIVPRHVEIMRETLKDKKHAMDTAVMDATDMSMFTDEAFDVVLNMGPFYHLLCFLRHTYPDFMCFK